MLLSLASIITHIEKVRAIPSSSIPRSNNNATTSLGQIAAKVGKIIGQRIVSTANGTPQIEQSIVENGTIKGVGNVTNLQTWIDTFRSPRIYGVGQGVITTADGQMATWGGI